ncbi:MAG TPA: hypothetical protein VGE21_14325 [Flavobacteriales bacterium]
MHLPHFFFRTVRSWTLPLVIASTIPVKAQQIPEWSWAKKVGSTKDEGGGQVLADGEGNAYVRGTFTSNSVVVGPYTFTNIPPAGNPFTAHYVVKYDREGQVLWGKGYRGVATDVDILCLDRQGNIYLKVNCTDVVMIDQLTVDPPAGGAQYLLKYTSAGQLLWARQLGTASLTVGLTRMWSLAALNDTQFVAVGSTWADQLLGQDLVQTYWLAKLDTAGTFQVLRKLGGIGPEIPEYPYRAEIRPSGLKVGPDGRILFIGDLDHVPDLDLATWQLPIAPQGGVVQGFIAQFDGDLGFMGSKVVHADVPMGIYSHAIDPAGNLYAFLSVPQGTVQVDDAQTIVAPNAYNGLLVKYDPTGSALWVRSHPVPPPANTPMGAALCTDRMGNVFMAGNYRRFEIDDSMYYAAGNRGLFIVKYDAQGTFQWFQRPSLGGVVQLGGLAENGTGELYLSGRYSADAASNGEVQFGEDVLAITNGSAPFMGDAFLAKLGECEAQPPIILPEGPLVLCPDGALELSGAGSDHYQWSTGAQAEAITVTEAGTYSVIGHDELGCYARSADSEVEARSVNVEVVWNGTSLIAEATEAAYQWMVCTGNGMTALDQATAPELVPEVSGSYAVVVAQNGCTDTSACMAVVVENVGMADGSFAGGLKIYPNPSNGSFTIGMEGGPSYRLEILDLLGRRCLGPLPLPKAGFVVEGLSSGVYSILLTASDGRPALRASAVVH